MHYPDEIIQKVWEKGERVLGHDPGAIRKDEYGSWILKDHYLKTGSDFSWEIECLDPYQNENCDDISKLRPINPMNKPLHRRTFFEKMMELYGSNFMLK